MKKLLAPVLINCCLTGSVCYALPFSIVPKAGTTLPTVVYTNSTTAYYTITNNTSIQRNNNYIKHLPANVSQVSTGGTYPDTCGSTFNLTPGGSCTLQLSVSGPVNGSDPDPTQHLFACIVGGISCAGTNYPLNVRKPGVTSIAVTPADQTINALSTLQFTATATYEDGATQNISSSVDWDSNMGVASVSSSGLAAGVTSGSTTITAKLGAVSGTTTLTVNAYAYITNVNNNTVSYCAISGTTSTLGSISSCSTTGSGFTSPYSIALNPTGTYAYIGSLSSDMVYCAINSDATLSGCTPIAGTSGAAGIAINSAGTYLYYTNNATNQIVYCSISSGALSGCTSTGSSITTPQGIALNPAGTYAYVASGDNKIYYCSINSNGSLASCNVFYSGLSSPRGIAFDFSGAFLFISNSGNNKVVYCSVNSEGSKDTCGTDSNTFTNLRGIALNGAGTFSYVIDGSTTNSLSYCYVLYNGTFKSCTPVSGLGLSNPDGIAVS